MAHARTAEADSRRECLECGAVAEGERCAACGSTALAPPRQRLAATRARNTPPARFARGQTRTGRPD